MKKLLTITSLVALGGALALGAISAVTANDKEVSEVNATLEYDIAITEESNFFTNWNDPEFINADGKTVPGQYKTAGASCWSGNMNVFGTFFDGCNDGYEGWRGTLKSRKWQQTTQWIYFQWGCAKDNNRGTDQEVKLVFNFYQNENDASPAFSRDYWNDTFSGCTMVLRNYFIENADFTALGGNFYMSVDLVDQRTGDYGAHEFGNLHVNQTQQQVSDAQWYYCTHCVDAERSVKELAGHYRTNESLRKAFVGTVGFAEDFESQEVFNANWVEGVYGNNIGDGGANPGTRHPDKAISESTYRTGSNMPFNKTGNGLFKGWFGGANDDYEDHNFGYTETDDAVYRFVSKPFILPDNGLVSIKMAGNSASLHLLDMENNSDLAWVDCKTFVSGGDENPIAKTGKNVCTMVRHIINFSKYGGRLVQLAIADVDNKEGGWNAVYFDELKANYVSNPTFKIDVVEQDKDGTTYATYKDVYVSSVEGGTGVDYANDDGPETDNSPLKGAYDVWTSYLTATRYADVVVEETHYPVYGTNYCDVKTSDAVVTMLGAYNGLSEAAKRIVCASDDYERVGSNKDNWWTINPTIYGASSQYSLGSSLQYFGRLNSVNVVVYNNGVVHYATSTDNTAIIVISAVTLLTALALTFVFFKRKQKAE